eukprot:10711158-Alexandrium_andersonii.AAC.1
MPVPSAKLRASGHPSRRRGVRPPELARSAQSRCPASPSTAGVGPANSLARGSCAHVGGPVGQQGHEQCGHGSRVRQARPRFLPQ